MANVHLDVLIASWYLKPRVVVPWSMCIKCSNIPLVLEAEGGGSVANVHLYVLIAHLIHKPRLVVPWSKCILMF